MPKAPELDNKRAQKHGGSGALQKITSGDDFVGLAAEHETEVKIELETEGTEAIVRRGAIRFQTVADLFYAALLGAAQDKNMHNLQLYSTKFAWLQAAALRAWAQVGEAEKADRKIKAVDVLKAIKGVQEDDTGQ